MPKKRFRSEDIIHKLREADVLIAQGRSILEITPQWGVTEATYYRWRKEFGGLKIEQAKFPATNSKTLWLPFVEGV